MVTITALLIPKLPMKRKSDKACLQAPNNLEGTSRGLVRSSQPARRIRPSHGGLVQYYTPDEVGRSSSTSDASSVSDLSSTASTPNSSCSQSCPHLRLCGRQCRRADKASTKNTSFSWKSGWHPTGKDDDHQDWRGGWPGSEHIPEWRSHMRPAQQVLSTPSPGPNSATSKTDIEPSYFVGCQQVMPDLPALFPSAGWDRFPRDVSFYRTSQN